MSRPPLARYARLPRFFVQRRGLAWVLFALALAAGAWAFRDLPRPKVPPVKAGLAVVLVPWPGHSVAEVEAALAVPFEAVLGADPDVGIVRTYLRPGLAVLEAELADDCGPPPLILARLRKQVAEVTGLPPGAGPVVFARDVGETASLLLALAGPAGAADAGAAIDAAAWQLAGALAKVPGVARVERGRALGERVLLVFDPSLQAALGVPEPAIRELLVERGLAAPGGVVELRRQPAPLPFRDAEELAAVPVGLGPFGAPLLLRDVADVRIDRGDGPRQLFGRRDPASGAWVRTPAATLALYRDPGIDPGPFREAVEAALVAIRPSLPADLIVHPVADEAREVDEALSLFTVSLVEAILLVVAVALIGFRGWRGAAVLALAIPVTLALTFVVLRLLGAELQQVSIGALILALGLLVDDPVVAADAAQRRVEQGEAPREAAWRGPVDLSRAILYATLTNVVAYLPLVIVHGYLGRYIGSIPIVVTVALLVSRLVSISFVPLFASHLHAGPPRPPQPDRVSARLGDAVHAIVARRWIVLGAAGGLLVASAAWALPGLRTLYFPRDPSRLYYVDVLAPDAAAARALEERAETAQRGDAVTTLGFIGRTAPRFWFSMFRDLPRPERAEVVVETADAETVDRIFEAARSDLASVPGALVDRRALEIGKPVGPPLQVRFAGPDPARLRGFGARAAEALAAAGAVGVRDDAGITPGPERSDAPLELTVGTIGQGLAAREVALRVLAPGGTLPGGDVPPRARRDGRPSVTVAAFPAAGRLASETLAAARPALDALARSLPAGYRLELGGEAEEQARGFAQLGRALALSVALIALALAVQFRSLRKPLLVFATIPFGVAGAFVALRVAGAPFGFMAFLGVASLVGVIVSHVIVLFDRIEALEGEGAPLESALAEAVRSRARPVLVTVAATVIALVPLMRRGGPLWEPLCYAQIGGLTLATAVTFVVVPALYAVAARDLRLIPWGSAAGRRRPG